MEKGRAEAHRIERVGKEGMGKVHLGRLMHLLERAKVRVDELGLRVQDQHWLVGYRNEAERR